MGFDDYVKCYGVRNEDEVTKKENEVTGLTKEEEEELRKLGVGLSNFVHYNVHLLKQIAIITLIFSAAGFLKRH